MECAIHFFRRHVDRQSANNGVLVTLTRVRNMQSTVDPSRPPTHLQRAANVAPELIPQKSLPAGKFLAPTHGIGIRDAQDLADDFMSTASPASFGMKSGSSPAGMCFHAGWPANGEPSGFRCCRYSAGEHGRIIRFADYILSPADPWPAPRYL